jgi:TldD protein
MTQEYDAFQERFGGRSEWMNRIGQRVLPANVSLVDDPTLSQFMGQPLLGAYQVDDEGVVAQRVSLVEDGILKNLLMSRRPGPDFDASNGHGRSASLIAPQALSSNLIFQATGTLAPADLRKKFLDTCREDGHEWCLEVKSMDNPAVSSLTQQDFSDFVGEMAGGISSGARAPLLVERVYVSDGHEEPVRGGLIDGLTVRTLRNILAIGSDSTVYDYMQNPEDGLGGTALGAFGEALGGIPSSIVAPSLLLEDVEVRGFHGEPRRLPLVPIPPLQGGQ